MDKTWELYDKLLGGGETRDPREVAIDTAVDNFVAGIVDDPAYREDATVNGVLTPLVVARETSIECALRAHPDTTLHIGDMVECLGQMWIVVELYTDEVGILNGTMWMCNDAINFQNRSPEIHTRYCVVDDGTYSKKSIDPDARLIENTYNVYITIDDATKRMFVDKRIAFGEIFAPDGSKTLEVYKIIGMDVKSKNYGEGSHLMVLTMQRDVYHAELDDIEKNICDFYAEDDRESSEPSQAGQCSVSGRDIIRIGTSRKYTASFTDAEGAEVSDVVAVWSVSAPDDVTFDPSGSECIVAVPLNGDLVGEEITICLKDSEDLFGVFEKKVRVVTVG
jgi:hypothetical protein